MSHFSAEVELHLLVAGGLYSEAETLLRPEQEDWRRWLRFLSAQQTGDMADKHVQSVVRGWEQLNQGKGIDIARTHFQEGLGSDTRWVRAWCCLGMAKTCAYMFDVEEGLDWCAIALALSREGADTHLHLAAMGHRGELLLKGGNLQAAMVCYQADLDFLPPTSRFRALVLCRVAHVHRALGETTEAETAYRLALHSPGHSMDREALTGLAMLAMDAPNRGISLVRYVKEAMKGLSPAPPGTTDFWLRFCAAYFQETLNSEWRGLWDILAQTPLARVERLWLLSYLKSSGAEISEGLPSMHESPYSKRVDVIDWTYRDQDRGRVHEVDKIGGENGPLLKWDNITLQTLSTDDLWKRKRYFLPFCCLG